MPPELNLEKYTTSHSSPDEGLADKLLRETQLVGSGLMGVKEGYQESIDHPWATAARASLSFGIGAIAARYSAAEGAGAHLLKYAGGAMGLSLAADVAARSTEIGHAMGDTWHSDQNWNSNVAIMKRDLGKFTFDTALMTASGLAGGKLGASLRPFNSPFHEDFLNSRSDGRVVNNDGVIGIKWDADPISGWHKPIYTNSQMRIIAENSGQPVEAIHRIAAAPAEVLSDWAQSGGPVARDFPGIKLHEGPAPDGVAAQARLREVVTMTENLRATGTLGNYFHDTLGLYSLSKQGFATRKVPRYLSY